MDSLRLGRVLGTGARHAAKTLLTAADAAAAPNPRCPQPPASAPSQPALSRPSLSQPAPPQPSPRSQPASAHPAPTRPSPITTSRGLAEGSRRFGRAVWGPAVRLSGVLWLELTGVFFGLFALVAALAAWKLRAAAQLTPAHAAEHTQLLVAVGMLLLFAYFSLSSFRSASQRSRRR